jgi:hypothetical protein
MQSLGIVLVVGTLALLVAEAAQAGEVRVVTECIEEGDSGGIETRCYDTTTYAAAPGESNMLTLSAVPAGLTLTDAGAPLTAGTGCVQAGPREATCPPGSFGAVRLDLGDEADVLAVSGSVPASIRPSVSAGPGDDVVTGGSGDDVLHGGPGYDRLAGGDGADELDGDSTRTEAFADALDGGPGRDLVTYAGRLLPVAVDLASPGTGGSPGEADSLQGIEDVRGGRGANRLLGDEGPNELRGGRGGNVLDGRGGDDSLLGDLGSDLLVGGAGDDDLHGGFGTRPDRLLGGDGDDQLTGGEGPDRLNAGAGDDVIQPRLDFRFQRLGPFDSIGCEDGSDLLQFPYRALALHSDCERVALDFYTVSGASLRTGGRVAVEATLRRNYRSDARPCGGALTLRTAARYEPGSATGRPRRQGAVPLARIQFRWRPREQRTFVLRLPRTARELLERRGRLRAELVFESFSNCGRPDTRNRGPASTFTVVLRPPA